MPVTEPRRAGESSLVVVTLNLLHGAPIPGAGRARGSVVSRLDLVAEQLAALSPDVVLLQEASRSARHDNTAALLARRLGMQWVYAPANPAWLWGFGHRMAMRLVPNLDFEEGPAILTRLPILERHVHRLSSPLAGFERRVALEAVLAGPNGPFSVFSVHLTVFSQGGRRRQIGALLRAIGSAPHHHPSIVGGDFNAEEHAHEIRVLTDVRGWIDSFRAINPDDAGHTSPQMLAAATATAGKRIDFLFSVPAGDERFQPSDARLILDRAFPATSDGVLWASDHYGVLARFTLVAAGGALPAVGPTSAAPPDADTPGGAVTDPAPPTTDLLGWQLPAPHRARAVTLITAATARRPADDWLRLPDAMRERHDGRIRAILGYGSWYTPSLRKPTSFPDLYLVVDDYARFHGSRFRAWMNRAVPPNVLYEWDDAADELRLCGKFNVITSQDLARESGPTLRDVYNAGRLAKLTWIAWAASPELRVWLVECLLDASQTMSAIVLGLLPAQFSARTFSLELLAASYRGEARLEGLEKVRALRDVCPPYYDALHPLLLDGFAAATGLLARDGDIYRKVPDRAWHELEATARRVVRHSRQRAYLRWLRIVLTEPRLVDLAANEAERKAGVHIRITPRLRRHPLLFGLPEFRRVLRERATRERIHPLR